MVTFLGPSWRTTLFGYVTGLVLVLQGMVQGGTIWPHDWPSRLQVIAGALIAAWGRTQKDANVSNAPNPIPEAQPVK
jgi:flagellar motor component MotA